MPAKSSLIYGVILSLALHIVGLAWCPAPVSFHPPHPLYLVVDLFSGPATSGTDHGPDATSAGGGMPTPATKIATKDSLQSPQPAETKTLTPCEVKIGPTPQPKFSPSADKSHREKPLPLEPAIKNAPLEKTLAPDASVEATNAPGIAVASEPLKGRPNSAGIEQELFGDNGKNIKSGPNGGTGSGSGTGSSSGPGSGSGRGGLAGSGSPVETPMAYGTNPPPPYPNTARRRGWEGEVLLLVDVTARGEVCKVTVSRSSGYQILDRAALNAIYRWQFQAAQKNGRAVAGQVMVPIRFSIKDAK